MGTAGNGEESVPEPNRKTISRILSHTIRKSFCEIFSLIRDVTENVFYANDFLAQPFFGQKNRPSATLRLEKFLSKEE